MTRIVVDLLQYTGTKGGIEAYIRELYKAIGHIDNKVEFVGFASRELFDSGDFSWFPGEMKNSNISGENRVSWAFGELFALPRFAQREKADLIHAPAMLGPWRSTMPTVITVHDLSYFTHPELMKTKVLTTGVKWMERLAAKNATRLISISQSTADLIPKYLHQSPSKTDVVLSAGRTVPTGPAKAVRRQQSLFVSAGQRSPYKSLETVLEAWALIPSDQRPQLIITGSHGEDPLIHLVERYKLNESVTLRGWISDQELNDLMKSCSAFIETTMAAGFGMPALESMSLGTPVILSDIPVFREIAGPYAEYFAPGNPAELAKTVIAFSGNLKRQMELQESGPIWASKYNWSQTAQMTLQSFQKALSQTI